MCQRFCKLVSQKYIFTILSTIILSTLVVSTNSSKAYQPYHVSLAESPSDSQKLPHHDRHQESKLRKNQVPESKKIHESDDPTDGFKGLQAFSEDITKDVFRTQLYNTSIALTSSLFNFRLPSNSATEEYTINMSNQTIFGMMGFLTTVLIFALPVLFTGEKLPMDARSNDGIYGIISKILRTDPIASLIKNGMHKKIGLEPEKCLQKTICEAHRAPENKRYGLLALPFQIFYPPLSKMEGRKIGENSFQKAAYVGKYQKTRCGKKYECFFDVLDLGRFLIDWYQYHNYNVINDDHLNAQ